MAEAVMQPLLRSDPLPDVLLARWYAASGDRAGTLVILERQYAARGNIQQHKLDPAFDAIRQDQRFALLLRKRPSSGRVSGSPHCGPLAPHGAPAISSGIDFQRRRSSARRRSYSSGAATRSPTLIVKASGCCGARRCDRHSDLSLVLSAAGSRSRTTRTRGVNRCLP